MVKKYIMEMYEEAVKEAVKNMSEMLENRRFRRSKDDSAWYSEDGMHRRALERLFIDADKKTKLEIVKGIAEGKFADGQYRQVDIDVLRDTVRKNIHDDDIVSASFNAMKTMLNQVTDYIKRRKEKKAVAEVNKMQDMLGAISHLHDERPNKLGKYTDDVYEVYKNMMKEYVLHDYHNDFIDDERISDYYYGLDSYKRNKEDVKEENDYFRQVDDAWKSEAAKQRIYDKLTKKQIAEWEKERMADGVKERAQQEDAKYVEDLKKFVKEHDNPELRKKRHEEMDIAWNIKERIDADKRKLTATDKEIADYEKYHAEQVKKEDARYKQELKDLAVDHKNHERNEEHQLQITEIRLKHGDEELQKGYENYKGVARKPKKGEKGKEISISRKVPKHAVFIARAESERRA